MQADDMLHTCGVLHNDVALLHLAGELDLATAPLVDRTTAQVLADHPRQLDMDVAALVFCDVAGLRALLRARHAARTQHTAFRLVGVHPRLHHILTLLDATDLLPPASF